MTRTQRAQQATPDAPDDAPLTLPRRAAAEFIGTGLLVAIVVGSGIMAQRLSPGDTGLQLLQNTIATALGLGVLIVVLLPISGAHFNPVVTAVAALLQKTQASTAQVITYLVAQTAGGISGALLANAMFDLPHAVSATDRVTPGRFLAEIVATAGLILVIFTLARMNKLTAIGPAVGAYIGAAYWFTSSTAFANPAVTIGRIFTDTFAGISPESALAFVGAQAIGGALGAALTIAIRPARHAPT